MLIMSVVCSFQDSSIWDLVRCVCVLFASVWFYPVRCRSILLLVLSFCVCIYVWSGHTRLDPSSSTPNLEIKQSRATSVLGWVTSRERVVSLPFSFFHASWSVNSNDYHIVFASQLPWNLFECYGFHFSEIATTNWQFNANDLQHHNKRTLTMTH